MNKILRRFSVTPLLPDFKNIDSTNTENKLKKQIDIIKDALLGVLFSKETMKPSLYNFLLICWKENRVTGSQIDYAVEQGLITVDEAAAIKKVPQDNRKG